MHPPRKVGWISQDGSIKAGGSEQCSNLQSTLQTTEHQGYAPSEQFDNHLSQIQIQSSVSPMCRIGPSSEFEFLNLPQTSSSSSSSLNVSTEGRHRQSRLNHPSPAPTRTNGTRTSQSHPQPIISKLYLCSCTCIPRPSSYSLSNHYSVTLPPSSQLRKVFSLSPAAILRPSIQSITDHRTRHRYLSLFLLSLLGISSVSCAPFQAAQSSTPSDPKSTAIENQPSRNQDLLRSISPISPILTQTQNQYLDSSRYITLPIGHASREKMDRIHPCRIPSNVGCKLKNAINCSLSVLPSGSQQPSSKPHSSSLRPHINSLSSTAVSESSKLLHGSWNKTQQSNVATFGKPVSESILLNEAAAAQQNVDGHQVASPINPKTNVPTFCEYVNGQWVLSDNWNLYGVSGPAQRHRPRSLIEDNAPINPANHLNSSSLAVAHHAAFTGEMLPLYEISPLNTGSQVSNSTNNGTKLYLPAGWNHTSPRGPLYVVPAIVTSSLFLALSVVGTVVFLVARRRAARNRARKASITQRDGDRSRDLSFKDEESAVEMLEDRVSHRRHQASQRLKTLTIIKILRKAGGKREARVKRLSTAAISTNSPSVILIEEAPLNSRALPSVWNTNRTTRRRTSRWSLPRAHLREDQNIHTLQSDTMPGSSDSPILPESEGNRELVSTPLDNSHNVDFQNARSENIQDPECPSISNSLASISRNNLLPNSSSSMPISGLRLVGDNDRPGHQPQPSSNTVGHQNTSRESVSPGPPCTSLSRSVSLHFRADEQQFFQNPDLGSHRTGQSRSRCSTLPTVSRDFNDSRLSPSLDLIPQSEFTNQVEPSQSEVIVTNSFRELHPFTQTEPQNSGESFSIQGGGLPPAYYSGRLSEDLSTRVGRNLEKQRVDTVEESEADSTPLPGVSQPEVFVAHVATDDKQVLERFLEIGSRPSGSLISASLCGTSNTISRQGLRALGAVSPSAPPLALDAEEFELQGQSAESSTTGCYKMEETMSSNSAGCNSLLPPPPTEFVISFNPNLVAAVPEDNVARNEKEAMMFMLPSAPPSAGGHLSDPGTTICTAPPYGE